MLLISETIETSGVKGPRTAKRYGDSPVDLSDPRNFTSGPPWEAFAKMRKDIPVAWNDEMSPELPGFWALTRYEDVFRVDGDPVTFSSQKGGALMAHGRSDMQLAKASLDQMLMMDGQMHLQLRREHMPYFTPNYLKGLTTKVEGEVTRLLDAMAPLGKCDLVEKLSAQLPLFTLCEILGVPQADRPKFLHWMHFLELANSFVMERGAGGDMGAAASELPPEAKQFMDMFQAAIDEMFAYGRDMLHKRRKDPQDDLMSAIARATIDGELLADEYLDGSWLLIVFAGNDTTRNTISGTMSLLTQFPEERAKLIAKPELLGGAVNEFIRMVSPVIYMRRTATKDTEIAGQVIAEGDKVVMYFGSANRDSRVFENPDQLDITRANADKHIAFGYGPHVCIGKRVAQLQLEAVYRQLLARFPDIRQAGPMDVAPNNFVYAIRGMPVEFTPER